MKLPFDKGRIGRRFSTLKIEGSTGLVTFVTGNDPDPTTFKKILSGISAAGADILEVGIPFSDPMADGISIQLSSQRALNIGTTIDNIFETISDLRTTDNDLPIVLMGYFNPIYSYGLENFAKSAAKAGVDGVIVVDLPPEEAEELNNHLRSYQLNLIFLVAPTTDSSRLELILREASGFLYCVAVKGVTGTNSPEKKKIAAQIKDIRSQTDMPVAVGFGIRTPEQASELAEFCDAIVVGSAIVDIIASNAKKDSYVSDEVANSVHTFISSLSNRIKDKGPQNSEHWGD